MQQSNKQATAASNSMTSGKFSLLMMKRSEKLPPPWQK